MSFKVSLYLNISYISGFGIRIRFFFQRDFLNLTIMIHMHLLLLCALVCMITAALAADEHKKSKNRNSKTDIYGERKEDEIMTSYSFERPVSDTSRVHYFSFYGYENLKIHRIEIRDDDSDGNNDWPIITQGGIDDCFVEISFCNKPKYGIKFTIVLYTNVQPVEIRRYKLVHAPADPSKLSEYDLFETSEPTGKLLPPVRVVATRKRPTIYSYSNKDNRIITQIEVLDDSPPNSHQCIPKIIKGGVGKRFLHVKCQESPNDIAYFILKIYLSY